jgi:hypothetical protein
MSAENLFGPVYTQFKNKPREAILHLMRVKQGECVKALYRKDIGYIDIVWGKVTDKVKHTGYGLAHIIDKHGREFKQLGFKIEDVIPIIILFGNLKPSKTKEKYVLESDMFRVIIRKGNYSNKEKAWVLTAFYVSKRNVKRKDCHD